MFSYHYWRRRSSEQFKDPTTSQRKQYRATWHCPTRFFNIAPSKFNWRNFWHGNLIEEQQNEPRVGRFQRLWPRRRTYGRNEGQVFQGICQACSPLNRSSFVGVRSIRDGDLFAPRLFLCFHRTSLPPRAVFSVKHHRSPSFTRFPFSCRWMRALVA